MAKPANSFESNFLESWHKTSAIVQELKENLPTDPKEFWLYLNSKGFFKSTWGNKKKDKVPKSWQPAKEQWDFYNWYQKRDSGLNIMLAMRGIAKSEILTIFDTVFKIAHNHHHSIVIARSNFKDACDFVYNCYKMLDVCKIAIERYSFTEGIYLYGSVDKEPVLRPLSTQQEFRGKHPKEVKIDDPIGEAHADSPVYRKRALDFIQSIMNSDSNKQLKILVIGQYVHPEDLFCHFKQLGTVPIYEGWIKKFGHLVKVNKEEYLKDNNLYNWGCNYEGWPYYAQDDAIFAKTKWTSDPVISWDDDVVIIDPAFTETKTSDRTALILIKKVGNNYILYIYAWKKEVYEVIRPMVSKIKRYNMNNGNTYFEGVQNKMIGEKLELYDVESSYFNSIGNKIRCIESIKSLVYENLYIHTDSDIEAAERFVRWTKYAEHDDEADGVSKGICILEGNKKYVSFKV